LKFSSENAYKNNKDLKFESIPERKVGRIPPEVGIRRD
jgi:hypothetical protein